MPYFTNYRRFNFKFGHNELVTIDCLPGIWRVVTPAPTKLKYHVAPYDEAARALQGILYEKNLEVVVSDMHNIAVNC